MGRSIKRTVVWDEVEKCWRDKATGVGAKDMPAPTMMRDGGIPWDYRGGFGVSYRDEDQAPSQLNIDKSIQQAIERELDKRTVFPLSRMYFNSSPDDDKLITIGYVKHMVMHEGKMTHDVHKQLENQVNALRQRIADLDQPWWKRWFSR